jgi:hypothetical protein
MQIKHPSRDILSFGIAVSLLGVMTGGCAPNATTFKYELPGSLQCESTSLPKLVSSEDNLSVWSYRGRLHVFGSKESGRAFGKTPMTEAGFLDTGAGPVGEDVVFETDAEHPGFSEELQERYRRAPRLLRRVGRDYSVWKRENRLFVLGPNESVEREFMRTGELTISKTFFNSGPQGETVVVEASKSKHQFADQLMERFNARPVLIEKRCPDYFVWKDSGRLIVLGSAESSLRLESGRWLPKTQALIGAGPQGETVVLETDNSRPELLQRLATAFFGEGKVPTGVLQD